jgi:hypothetical protein
VIGDVVFIAMVLSIFLILIVGIFIFFAMVFIIFAMVLFIFVVGVFILFWFRI